MIKIAITGNIASGKSTVQEFLEEKGYKVLDTDKVSHELLTVKNSELFNAFKDYDVFENGEFSRYKVGQLIFSDENARNKIASIMHPQIANKIKEFFVENSRENIIFVGIPLLFEAKMEYLFDKILLIYTDDDIRLERLLKRNRYTKAHAKARINSQMPQNEKIALSDYVIKNNKNINDLILNVNNFLDNLKPE